jgi:hypothetical protein
VAEIPGQKYAQEFERHLSEVDDVALVVLKGHLIIESALDNIIDTIFFHPEYLRQGRLTFTEKLRIARSFTLDKDKIDVWDRIIEVNGLRNEIAHSLKGEKRHEKMARLRQNFLAGTHSSIAEAYADAPDGSILILACSECAGFLNQYEDDLKGLRRHLTEVFGAPPHVDQAAPESPPPPEPNR